MINCYVLVSEKNCIIILPVNYISPVFKLSWTVKSYTFQLYVRILVASYFGQLHLVKLSWTVKISWR